MLTACLSCMTQLSQHNSIHLQVVWIQCWFFFAYITHLALKLEVPRPLYTCLMLIHVPIGRRLPHKNRLPTCCTSRWRSERCSSHMCNYPALSGSHDSDYPDHYPERPSLRPRPVTGSRPPGRSVTARTGPRSLACSASIWYSLCALSSYDSCLWCNVGAGND